MTIAAGVRCSDGIVICADTELTAGEGRFDRPKIFACEDWLVTGAGAWDYIKMASDKLTEAFQSILPQTPSEARNTVEQIVTAIYEEHIFKLTSSQFPVYSSPPQFDLIVATRCGDGQLALIKTALTATFLSSHYEAIGIGTNVFEYWAKYFLNRPRTMDVVAYFCMFILREVKSAVPGCGGSSVISKLALDKKTTKMFTAFFTDEDILAGFPQSAINVLLECADSPNVGSNFAMGQFKQTTDQLKGWFRNRLEMKERGENIAFTATMNSALLPPKKQDEIYYPFCGSLPILRSQYVSGS
jgi:hypothetical protein